MGTWGTSLYSDDFAADLRDDIRDSFLEGLSPDGVLQKLTQEYASSLEDPEAASVFWLVLAHAAWKLGRPIALANAEALRIIDAGTDLANWPDEQDRQKRRVVLDRIAAELSSEPNPPKRLREPKPATGHYANGEIIGCRLQSGTWALFAVVTEYELKGGHFPVYAVLDWSGSELPSADRMAAVPLRPTDRWARQLSFDERTVDDPERFIRTNVQSSLPLELEQERVTVFPFSILDHVLRETFGLD